MMRPWRRADLSKVWTWPHIFWFNIFAWWAEDIQNKILQRIAMKFRIILLIINVWFIFSLMTNNFVEISNNGLTNSLFTIFASLPAMLAITKLAYLIKYRRELRKAIDDLDDLLLDTINKGVDPVLEVKVRKHYARCWLLFYFLLVVGSMITLHWLMRPIMLALGGIKTSIVVTYPNMIETWTQVFVTYALQAINIATGGHAFYMFDNFYFCMAENILVQFTILRHNLHNMNITTGKPGNITIKTCAEHHNKILRICETLRVSSVSTILFQCFHTVLLLCSGVFELTLGKKNLQVFMNLAELTLIIIFILYCYCWYSNEITFQCRDLLHTLYMTDWLSGTVEDRRIVVTMMSMTMHPVVFGGIVKINLNTFLDVLKTTFSYYNFLTAVDLQ